MEKLIFAMVERNILMKKEPYSELERKKLNFILFFRKKNCLVFGKLCYNAITSDKVRKINFNRLYKGYLVINPIIDHL